jgi:hypothetical protein
MRNGPLLLTGLLVLGTAAARVTNADVASNPYRQVIVDRNVFGLKSPPPAPDPGLLKPPPPKIILLGIVNVFGTKKAVLKSAEAPKPAAPGQPPVADVPYVINEGDMQQGITVLTIDEKGGSVGIDNNGQPETLTFEKNGAKLTPGPAVPAPGAVPAGMPGGIPRPGMPGGLPLRPGMPGMPTPTMPGAIGGQGVGASGLPGTSGLTPGVGLATTDSGLPARPVRTESVQNTVEQNVLLYEAARMRNEELTKAGLLPRMPVHPLIRRMEEGGQNMPQPTQ